MLLSKIAGSASGQLGEVDEFFSNTRTIFGRRSCHVTAAALFNSIGNAGERTRHILEQNLQTTKASCS